MKYKQKGALTWLEFELLQEFPHVRHGIFLRETIEGLNLTQETPAPLQELAQQALGLTRVVVARQCHGIEILSDFSAKELICDGLMTREKGEGLVIWHADCQAAIFYDRKNQALCNVHCGWRGNVQNIYAKAVERMQRRVGTSPRDLLVSISPSLGPEAAEFINYQQEFPLKFHSFQERPNYFNLWEISRQQLIELDIPAEQIEIAGISTFAHPDAFFSYRRDKTPLRNVTIAGLT